MLILDTDHLSFLEQNGHPIAERMRRRIKDHVEECVATVISYEEQCRGWMSAIANAKSISNQIVAYRKLLAQLRNYCAMRVIEFDEPAATEFHVLKKSKVKIGTMDLRLLRSCSRTMPHCLHEICATSSKSPA
jgi:tRNA(fMet)-specific endonuclease VapC